MLANKKAEEFYSSEEGKPRTRIQVGSYDIHYHCLLLIVEIQDLRIIEPIVGYDPIACHEEWELHSADLYGLVTRDGLWESERLATMTDREIAQEHVARCKAFLGSWYNR